MRQIKFRAYDKARNEYLSAGKIFLTINGGKNPTDSVQYLDVLRDPNMYADRFVIEQFTGLHDKNGKEIYEGDILRSENGYAEPIGWSQDNAGFATMDFANGEYIYEIDQFLASTKTISGTIHDNPELLK